jgi:hypothetical protein
MNIIPVQRKNYQVIIPVGEEYPDLTPPSLRSQGKLNVCISTCDRANNYIHQALASMYMGGFPTHYDLHLFVSGTSGDYLDRYGQHRHVKIHPTTPQNWTEIAGWPKKFKASYNYLRCLSEAQYPNSLIFEDDIVFQDGWWQKFLYTVSEIERDGYERYILSLFPPNKCKTEKSYFFHPKMAWACSQGIYFPAAVRDEIANFVWTCTNAVAGTQAEPSDPPYLNAYDMLIKEYVLGHGIEVFCTVEALVQHVGMATAGGTGQNIVTSPVFYA